MASLPLDPIYAHLIFHSVKLECVKEVLTAVAMLSAENVLFFPPPGVRHRTVSGSFYRSSH